MVVQWWSREWLWAKQYLGWPTCQGGLPMTSASVVKNPPTMQETWVWSLSLEDPLEEGRATHSSVLARKIPWTEEPGGLRSAGSQRSGHDWSHWAHTLVKEPGGQQSMGLQRVGYDCAQLLSHVQLFMTAWTVARQALLSVELSRQESWSRLPFPSPGDLPHPEIEPAYLMSPVLAGRFFTSIATWEALSRTVFTLLLGDRE